MNVYAPITERKVQVFDKTGTRIDDHVISVDFKNGTVVYTDKKSIVHYEAVDTRKFDLVLEVDI